MKKYAWILLLSSLVFASCEDINWGDNQEDDGFGGGSGGSWGANTVTFDDATVESIEGQLIQGMEYVIDFREHKYQYQRNLNVDVYAGYMSLCMDFDGRQPSTYYYPNNPFIAGPYGETPKLYPYIAPAISAASDLGRGDLAAIAKIMYGYSMLAIADCFGPIAYYDWRVLKETYPLHYLSPREAYGAIIQDLRDAVDTLNVYQPTVAQLKRVEGSTAGSPCGWMWQNWVKFANSIQLRMALNMANVKEPIQLYRNGLDNPTTAETPQEIAEKAVAAGVLEYGDDDIGFKSKDRNLVHPLYKIAVGWEDTRLSASLENIAKRYQHPMLEHYFINNGAGKHGYDLKDKGTGVTTLKKNTMRVGVRQGIILKPQSQSKNDYLTFSEVSTNVQFLNFTWIKVAEVVFLQAEGALRGWNMGGTAQSFYEDGIAIGFEEIGATAQLARYMSQETLQPVDYVDYYDKENNLPGRVTVGVKWNDADDNEVKLEKIITQKWFANFPMSLEAWTTFRRTGYPRLFPVKLNQWNYAGRPDNEIQIRRIPWGDTPTTSEEIENYNTYLLPAAQQDGGQNLANSPLFWDISDSWSKDPEGKVVPVNF